MSLSPPLCKLCGDKGPSRESRAVFGWDATCTGCGRRAFLKYPFSKMDGPASRQPKNRANRRAARFGSFTGTLMRLATGMVAGGAALGWISPVWAAPASLILSVNALRNLHLWQAVGPKDCPVCGDCREATACPWCGEAH